MGAIAPEQLERQIRGKICAECHEPPRVVWLGALTGEKAHGLRCGCWPQAPRLVKAEKRSEWRWRTTVNQQLSRQENQGEKGIVRYQSDHGEVALSVRVVKEAINDKVTDIEAYAFIQMCKAYQLNPFANGEVWLIKYDDRQPASMQVGKNAYLIRAEQNPTYQGAESGVIVRQGDEEKEIPGAVVPKGAELVGGWCKVYRAGRRVPIYKRITTKEVQTTNRDGKPNRFWASSPAMMSEIAAIRQAHREAYPSMFVGFVNDVDLSQVDTETGEIMESPQVIESQGRYADEPQQEDQSAPAEDTDTDAPAETGVDQDAIDRFWSEIEAAGIPESFVGDFLMAEPADYAIKYEMKMSDVFKRVKAAWDGEKQRAAPEPEPQQATLGEG